jgi:prepilin-type processing-associated H-X9-DG protein
MSLLMLGFALLASWLPMCLATERSRSRTIGCRDNLRALGQAMSSYVEAGGYFPPVFTRTPRHHSWVPRMLPHLGHTELAARYDFSVHWCDPLNAEVIATRVPQFECPSAAYPGREAVGETQLPYRGKVLDYLATNRISPVVVNDGWLPRDTRVDGILSRSGMTHRSAVRDGLSHTLLLCEVAGVPAKYIFREKQPRPMYGDRGFGAWADFGNYFQAHGHHHDGRDWPGPCTINCTNDDAIWSFHPGGANLLWGDGSVRFVAEGLDLYTLFAWFTKDNGEVVAPAAESPWVRSSPE